MSAISQSAPRSGNRTAAIIIAVVLGLAILAPHLAFISDYNLYVLTLAAIYALPATGLTLFMGYTGQLSIGHAAFYGIGAYTAANLTKGGVPFLLALFIAMLVSGAVGFVLGLIALRLRGFALAMATLALGLVSFQIFKNFDIFTGGVSGLGRIPAPSVASIPINSSAAYYYLSLSTLLIVILISVSLVRSPTGRAMRAIANNELASQSLGINTYFVKTSVFALSAGFTGIAGGLYAHLIRYISPDDFSLIFSILFLTMAIVGGLRSVYGGVVGSLAITLAAEELRTLPQLQPILYGSLLILLVLFMPYGIVGAAGILRDRLAQQWRARRRPPAMAVLGADPSRQAANDQGSAGQEVKPP